MDPALNLEQRQSALAFAQASGYLKQWIMFQLRFAAQAKAQQVELEEALAQVRAGGDDEDDGADQGGAE